MLVDVRLVAGGQDLDLHCRPGKREALDEGGEGSYDRSHQKALLSRCVCEGARKMSAGV